MYSEPHPAKGYLAQRRMSVRGVAPALGFNAQYFSRVSNSDLPASRRVRVMVGGLLGRSEEELFWPDGRTTPRRQFSGDVVATSTECQLEDQS